MILAGLLLMITSLVYSNNLDKYESKRVFDKYTDMMQTGDLEKYINDPEMTVFYKEYIFTRDNDDDYDEEWPEIFKNNKYEVIEVKEGKRKSILTVKVTFISFSDIAEEEVLKKADKNNLERKTKVIKVGMIKKNGHWDFDITDDGYRDFILILAP